MRYVMKRKVFSFTRRFAVANGEGEDMFSVNGLGFGLDIGFFSIRDTRGARRATICRKFVSWNRAYEIRRADQPVVTVGIKGAGAGFQPLFVRENLAFTVTIPGGRDWVIERNLTGVTCEFKRGDKVFATFAERKFSIAGVFDVEVADGEDEVFVLACVAVALFMHRRKR